MKVTLKQLADLEGEPAISLLCPLDVRAPGNAHDPRVLAALRDRAAERLEASFPGADATAALASLDAAIASLDWLHPAPGVAVLAATDVASVVELDDAVAPHLSVGKTFVTHDLVAALVRRPIGRVISLSRRRTRCIDITRRVAVERLDHGFPVVVQPATEMDTPHRDFPLSEHEADEAAMFVFRAAAHALAELERHEPRTLVVVGTERDVAYFEGLRPTRPDAIGHIHGNHDRNTAHELGALARPLLDERARARELAVCDEVRDSLGTHAVSGIVASWTAARDGRGYRLVVEDGFRAPARIDDGELHSAADDDAGAVDAVDEVVDAVVRHGGEIVPVAAGELADLGHIALQLRG